MTTGGATGYAAGELILSELYHQGGLRIKVSIVKGIPMQAMRDLNAIGHKYAEKTQISYRDQARATVALCGICYSVSVGGRNGEWADMKEEYTKRELFEKNLDHLIMDNHKTCPHVVYWKQFRHVSRRACGCCLNAFEVLF